MSKRSKVMSVFILLAIAIVFAGIGVMGGCDAHRRPPALNPDEVQMLRAAPLPYTVVVQLWDPATAQTLGGDPMAYAQGLTDILIPSRAFRSSRFAPRAQQMAADLIATSTGIYCNSAVIPFYTIISLGFYPTIFTDENCAGMDLRQPGSASAQSVRIEYRYAGRVVMGWAAVFVGMLPGWSYGSVRNDSRFREHFRLEIIRKQSAIKSLLGT